MSLKATRGRRAGDSYTNFDFEAEAQAAEALVYALCRTGAPAKLVKQAEEQVIWLRERAARAARAAKCTCGHRLTAHVQRADRIDPSAGSHSPCTQCPCQALEVAARRDDVDLDRLADDALRHLLTYDKFQKDMAHLNRPRRSWRREIVHFARIVFWPWFGAYGR